MIRVMSDHDVEGLVWLIIAHCRQPEWCDVWDALDIEVLTFGDFALREHATDEEVWLACQHNDVILLTGNRNADDPTSLEIVIRTRNTSDCLPVLTFGDLRRLRFDSAYLHLTVERFLERLLDIDALRGTGRQFIP